MSRADAENQQAGDGAEDAGIMEAKRRWVALRPLYRPQSQHPRLQMPMQHVIAISHICLYALLAGKLPPDRHWVLLSLYIPPAPVPGREKVASTQNEKGRKKRMPRYGVRVSGHGL